MRNGLKVWQSESDCNILADIPNLETISGIILNRLVSYSSRQKSTWEDIAHSFTFVNDRLRVLERSRWRSHR